MELSKDEMLRCFSLWLTAWDEYDLDNVLQYMHDDVVFENWDGKTVYGKTALQKAWTPWFIFNGNFRFIKEDVFIDILEQKLSFQWQLEWPSQEKDHKGKHEVRRGVDILHFLDGKIIKKYSYSKTMLQIDAAPVVLHT